MTGKPGNSRIDACAAVRDRGTRAQHDQAQLVVISYGLGSPTRSKCLGNDDPGYKCAVEHDLKFGFRVGGYIHEQETGVTALLDVSQGLVLLETNLRSAGP